ncbi:MAG: hypothetical protein HZB33_10145 [Nitrospirae bacterium]|nr:hypothetical protein [Nitrospirota bacterium]
MDGFVEKMSVVFEEGQPVELVISGRTDIGYKVIIDDSRWGMLYANEVFQDIKKGQRIQGFIKKVRDDGKIDVCLQRPGHEMIADISEQVLDKLKLMGGFMAVTDGSAPEIIYRLFGVSKKTYKKAIGSLYKRHLIVIEENGIRLAEESDG